MRINSHGVVCVWWSSSASPAQGASVRNFGTIRPIGQPAGSLYQLARRSREIWLDVVRSASLWHDPCGSLHLAYHDDEAQVLREFLRETAEPDRACELLSASEIVSRFPAVRVAGLKAALFSPVEVTVDLCQVIRESPWLSREHGVDFQFDTTVQGYDASRVFTTRGEVAATRFVICTGADFRELAPEAFADSGLIACKLQMMRSQPYGERLPHRHHARCRLTLKHYNSFKNCPTLPALIRRLDAEFPEYVRYGIHVLVSQNGQGELILGDSHEYGDAIEPFESRTWMNWFWRICGDSW